MNKEQYEQRFMRNQKITGTGMDTTMHTPCPFCAAPDFLVYRIMEVEKAMQSNSICKECGRGARAVFDRRDGHLVFEFVQTQGDAAPDYAPRMRRENE